MEKLTVAVAGCHRMVTRTAGSHNFGAALQAVAETDVVAVFDFDSATRDEFTTCWEDVWPDVVTYDDYEQMMTVVQPDLLCLATRQTMHADQIEIAVQSGVKGILCDKPLVTSLAEMDRVLSACRDVPLLFALDRRWFDRYRTIRRLIAEGLVGDVTSIVSYGLSNLINHGCHWYDSLLALAGDVEPIWVSGLVEDLSDEPADSRRRIDPSGRAQIGLDNGIVLYITADGKYAGQGLPMSFEVVGQKGRLFVLNDANQTYHWTPEEPLQMKTVEVPPATEPWAAGPAMVADLVAAVANGKRTACDVDEARRATEIGFAIHQSSAANGSRIDLPVTDRSLRIGSFPWGNEPT